MTSSPLRDAFRKDRVVPSCPLYDMHGHWGPFHGASLPCADDAFGIRCLERAGVRRLVLCHHDALFAPEIGNAANVRIVRNCPERLRAYCGVNPNYPSFIARDIRDYDRIPDVFVGFKMLSDYHGAALTDDRYRPVWEMANARRLPVLAHTWGASAFNGYPAVRTVAERYPDTRFLLGHSLHGDWDRAIALARDCPNVYLELTAILDERGIVERFLEGVGSTRIVFGTDFPWFSEFYYLGALLDVDMSDDDLHNILHRNAQKLLGEQI